ncbi:MAG: hypothetical protein IJ301_00560 [Clostridia bacterium]|nr:hypothetical protein [Clostridia bacterium]
MEEKLTPNNPKVIEMSYNVFEKILTSIDYKTKDELIRLADVMLNKVQDQKYPEILRMAYADAKRKIELLSLEQLNEIKQIITAD